MRTFLLSALLLPSLASADPPAGVELDTHDLCPDRYLSETFVTGAPCATTGLGAGIAHEIAHYRIHRVEAPVFTLPGDPVQCVDGAVNLVSTTTECIPFPLGADPSWTPFQTLLIP